ncbi:hypothetical protein [Amycolatopsis albispora]|nr:hypothetical protein [Amycolatopsis albispora]
MTITAAGVTELVIVRGKVVGAVHRSETSVHRISPSAQRPVSD